MPPPSYSLSSCSCYLEIQILGDVFNCEASSVLTRCHLINSNCCPHIGGIPQPAPCWTNLSYRLPLWSRTVEGGCDIPDDFYSHYFQHLVLHRPGGVRACFLDQPHGSPWLSSFRRWNIWVKLELLIYPSPRGYVPVSIYNHNLALPFSISLCYTHQRQRFWQTCIHLALLSILKYNDPDNAL